MNNINHSFYLYGGLILIFIGLILLIIVIWRRRKLNNQVISERWKAIQRLCANKEEWPAAVIGADKLLDDVLKKRKMKGKTTGERLVAAQHIITNNEAVWFGHKLRNKIINNDIKKINKKETIEALSGFHKAMKDLGALFLDKKNKSENSQQQNGNRNRKK